MLKNPAAVKALTPASGADAGDVVWSFPVQTSGGSAGASVPEYARVVSEYLKGSK